MFRQSSLWRPQIWVACTHFPLPVAHGWGPKWKAATWPARTWNLSGLHGYYPHVILAPLATPYLGHVRLPQQHDPTSSDCAEFGGICSFLGNKDHVPGCTCGLAEIWNAICCWLSHPRSNQLAAPRQYNVKNMVGFAVNVWCVLAKNKCCSQIEVVKELWVFHRFPKFGCSLFIPFLCTWQKTENSRQGSCCFAPQNIFLTCRTWQRSRKVLRFARELRCFQIALIYRSTILFSRMMLKHVETFFRMIRILRYCILMQFVSSNQLGYGLTTNVAGIAWLWLVTKAGTMASCEAWFIQTIRIKKHQKTIKNI